LKLAKRTKKIDRITDLLLALTVKSLFDDHWNSLTDTERHEEATVSGPKMLRELEELKLTPEDQVATQAVRRVYKELAKNICKDPKKRIELCTVALQSFSGEHAAVLLSEFTEELTTLIRGNLERKSEPRKWTGEIVLEAQTLFLEFHKRTREARKYCNRNPRTTGQGAADEDRRQNPKRPKMPREIIDDLPRRKSNASKQAKEIATEWTAIELNRRHPDLKASPGYLGRRILKIKADVKADRVVM